MIAKEATKSKSVKHRIIFHSHNEPQPKRLLLTEWNSHGIFFREPFHFREPKFPWPAAPRGAAGARAGFAFFAQI